MAVSTSIAECAVALLEVLAHLSGARAFCGAFGPVVGTFGPGCGAFGPWVGTFGPGVGTTCVVEDFFNGAFGPVSISIVCFDFEGGFLIHVDHRYSGFVVLPDLIYSFTSLAHYTSNFVRLASDKEGDELVLLVWFSGLRLRW